MIRVQFRPVRCQACGARLDRGVPFLRQVSPSLLLMHSLCDVVPREVVGPRDELFRSEYMNANIALVTEALREDPSDQEYLDAARRVIEEVPHRTQVVLSGYLAAMVVGELAKAQARTREEVWHDIALQFALAMPEDG